MNKKMGFIGCGNMAKAMIGGIINSEFIDPLHVIAANPSLPSLEEIKNAYGICITQSNLELANECDIIFLTVKPHLYAHVIDEIKNIVKESAIIIMVGAGQGIEDNEQRFGRNIKLVRAMPNTPALVEAAMTGISFNSEMTPEEKVEVKTIFECFGKVEFVDEKLMDVVTGVSGSSPAYTYLFIEALADSAVLHGMPRKQAYIFASQAVLGAAKMVLETGIHPGELKDRVCSPGGTTIEAVASLEASGFRSAVIDAVSACVEKSKLMK